MAKTRVLVTGSSGMLGKDVVAQAAARSDWEVVGISRSVNPHFPHNAQWVQGDLADSRFLRKALDEINPNVVLCAAAMVHIEQCEKDQAGARAVNVEATRMLSSVPGVRLVYVATDSIFDGQRGNYLESDEPHPMNFYAKTKVEGEQVALTTAVNAVSVRSNIYGFHYEPPRHGPRASLAEWAMESLASGKQITGFTDVFFNPLYTGQLAQVLVRLGDVDGPRGIVNGGCREPVSKDEFVRLVAKTFGLPTSLIKSGSIDDGNLGAPRPKNTTVDVTKLKNLLGLEFSIFDGLLNFKRDLERSRL